MDVVDSDSDSVLVSLSVSTANNLKKNPAF